MPPLGVPIKVSETVDLRTVVLGMKGDDLIEIWVGHPVIAEAIAVHDGDPPGLHLLQVQI